MGGPLTGIRVVEMSTHVAAPSCGELLARLGAEVIKIESLDGEPYRTALVEPTGNCTVFFDLLNAGKKSVAANAKNPEVAAILKKLIGTADVFFSNIRMDALGRLGLNYESLKSNEKLIYVHFSGYGEKGPLAKLPGYDGNAFFVRQGIYRDFNDPDHEPINHISGFGDVISGLSMTLNIMAALMERNRTGQGRKITCALNQNAVWTLLMPMVFEQFGSFYQRKERHPTDLSTTSMLCKDGEYIYYNASMIKQWRSLCKALGKEELIDDPRCVTLAELCKNTESLYDEIADAFKKRNVDEWVDILRAADVPCEKYRHVADIATDEQLIENGFIRKCQYDNMSVMVPVPPIEPSLLTDCDSESQTDKGAPLGAHTKDIFKELGCSDSQIEELIASGNIIASE